MTFKEKVNEMKIHHEEHKEEDTKDTKKRNLLMK